MFCGKCGKEIQNDVRHCPFCGAPTNNMANQTPIYTYAVKHKTSHKRKIAALGVIVAISIVVIIIISVVGNSGYKKTLNNYYKAYETQDAELMYSSVIAQYWIDYKNEGWGNIALETIEDDIDDQIEKWQCGDNIKITYKINSERRATKEELKELEDNLYSWYAYYVYDRDEFSISDAYVLDIDFTVKGPKGENERHYPDGLLVIKENGKWRIPRGSISCSFYDNQ